MNLDELVPAADLSPSTHSDIHSVPTELRAVLEQCLAEDPTPETLAIFMPDVRRVLFKLLRGLQSKQEVWKAKASRVGSMSSR